MKTIMTFEMDTNDENYEYDKVEILEMQKIRQYMRALSDIGEKLRAIDKYKEFESIEDAYKTIEELREYFYDTTNGLDFGG